MSKKPKPIPSAYEDIIPPPLPEAYVAKYQGSGPRMRKKSRWTRMWEWLLDKLNPPMR